MPPARMPPSEGTLCKSMSVFTALLWASSESLKKEKGLEVPIHVDAASGGFIAPFLYPNLR